MELIVGFNLSTYSHCTSYTRLTTNTGNCCRACDWLFIKSINIVIPYSRLLSRGSKKIFVYGSSYLKKLLLHLSKFHRESIHNWSSNRENSLSTIRYTIIDLPIENAPYQIWVWWNIDIVGSLCKNVISNKTAVTVWEYMASCYKQLSTQESMGKMMLSWHLALLRPCHPFYWQQVS